MSRIRIPTSLNRRPPFLSWGIVKMDMKQLVTVAAGLFFWLGISKVFVADIFDMNILFAMVGCIWIPIIAITLAYVKIRNRPIDEFLGDKLAYKFSPRTYVLRETDNFSLNKDYTQRDIFEQTSNYYNKPQVFVNPDSFKQETNSN